MSSSSVVGRKLEVDTIGDLLRAGGPLIVIGPAGIGKSSLLSEAERMAGARGMQVLSMAGVQAETDLPFAGLHQLLRPIMRGADELPPPQRDALAPRSASSMMATLPTCSWWPSGR